MSIKIKSIAELPAKHKNTHPPYEFYKRNITARGETQLLAAVYELPPNKSAYPFHYHEQNDELFYILSGTGTLCTPDDELAVSAGDAIVCPRGSEGAHKLTNASDSVPLCYLDVDTHNSPDIVHYPDSGKTGVSDKGKMTITKNGLETGYYDGE